MSLWKKKKLSKDEFDKKCLCGHAKSSHNYGCFYCDSCEFYEPQAEAGKENEREGGKDAGNYV